MSSFHLRFVLYLKMRSINTLMNVFKILLLINLVDKVLKVFAGSQGFHKSQFLRTEKQNIIVFTVG